MHKAMMVVPFAILMMGGGCNPYQCTYETRFVGTSGVLTTASGTVTVAYVNMREYRSGGPVSNYITWSASAENLTSPPRNFTLTNAAGTEVATLTLTHTSNVSMTAFGSIETQPGDTRFVLLTSGQARAVLELENGETIVVPLAVGMLEDWHHPDCS